MFEELTSDQQKLADRIAADLGAVQAAQDKLRNSVRRANAAGVSWAEIGLALGVSRQAAWERFGKQ